MKRIVLLNALFVLMISHCTQSIAQCTTTTCEGSTVQPTTDPLLTAVTALNPYFATTLAPTQTKAQYIFTAAELAIMLGGDNTISSIGYYLYDGPDINTGEVTVGVQCTSDTAFASSTFEPIGSFIVVASISSTTVSAAAQWVYLDFDTPYMWDGTSNLMISVCTTTDNTTTTPGLRLVAEEAGMSSTQTIFRYWNSVITGDVTANGCDETTGNLTNERPILQFKTCSSLSSTIDTVIVCQGDSLFTNGNWETSAGNYGDTTIVINTPNVTVNQTGTTLTADATGVLYQWIDCKDDSIISGATSQTFTPSEDGDYAVIINDNGCIDTSSCFTVNTAGLTQLGLNNMIIYPNPTNGDVFVEFSNLNNTFNVSLYDVFGKQLWQKQKVTGQLLTVPMSELVRGAYILEITDNTGNRLLKRIIKQ